MARLFGVSIVRQLAGVLISQTREALTAQAEKRLKLIADAYAMVLWRGREQIEMALGLQVKQIESALASQPPSADIVHWSDTFNHHVDLPPDATPMPPLDPINESPSLSPMVAFSTQVFHSLSQAERGRLEPGARRLLLATPALKALSQRLGKVVLWQYTCLDSGLLAGYPAHSGLPGRLDPLEQVWYRFSLDGRGYWSDPYFDPATRQMVVACVAPVNHPNGKRAGATAIVVAISFMLEQRMLTDAISPQTCAFMSYIATIPQTGQRSARIFAANRHHERQHRGWRFQPQPQWLFSDDDASFQALMDDVSAGRSGLQRMPFEGRDSLWAWGLTQENAFFVLITPYEEILIPAGRAEKTVQDAFAYLLRISAVGFGLIAAVAVILALAFSRTVTRPLQAMVEAAEKLADGRFDTRVAISTGDEFEDMGRVFNAVVPRLEEHTRMRQSLALAREVQDSLLPTGSPAVHGLDIAGNSLSCDETGGDYYDFIQSRTIGAAAVAVAVGDVSDHGIPSALLMTTARAFLRQRRSLPGSIEHVIQDVNRQLTHDVGGSGRFMTLFYGEIDRLTIRWIRAGHDPAMLFDPSSQNVVELGGKGVALGLDENSDFIGQARDLRQGQVIVIGTDGIWETSNPNGERFGKERLRDIIVSHASAPAAAIVAAVIDALAIFRGPAIQEDDITLVVIKVVA
jgi:sigma-B regulation protein RsbU (phosphoserine phosphatase)